jgi:thiol:disulfide interchange protein DsbD
MVTLKRSLGVIELALAVKFLSNADLVLGTGLLSREVVIGCWTLAAAVIAVIIARDATHRASVRLALGAVAMAAAIWVASGLSGRSLGELEAYLPPRLSSELPWTMNDYEGALAAAAAGRQPLFVDFTGYTCTNCRWMEANMFDRPDVRERLERYARVRLYTDGQGAIYERQQRMQERDYGTVALPYYAIVGGDGRPIATFLGMTRDPEEFIRFLDQALTTSHASR